MEETKNIDSNLRKKVQEVVRNSSIWQRYGVDGLQFFMAFPLYIVGLYALRFQSVPAFLFGVFALSIFHTTIGTRASHAAVHGSLSGSPKVNKFFGYIFSDVVNQFSFHAGYVIHIKGHHPYTNVIGYGDSSTFKAPFLSRYVYLFLLPLLIPFTGPIASLGILRENKNFWRHTIVFFVLMTTGLAIETALLVYLSELTFGMILLVMYLRRVVFAPPFLHVNVFQHIGLEFYEFQSRPKSKVYQMTHSVLNLTNCGILEYVFGSSICSCHIEHHIFPNLSDNILKSIRPIVKKEVLKNKLPYLEKSYGNRLILFMEKYKELLVDPPSILSMAGIQ